MGGTLVDTYKKSALDTFALYDQDAEHILRMSEGERAAAHIMRPHEFTRFSVGGIVRPSSLLYEIERKWYGNSIHDISGNAKAKMATILENHEDHSTGEFYDLDRALTKQTRNDFDHIFVGADAFYEQYGPSKMNHLTPFLSHVGLQLLDDHYGEQTVTSTGRTMSDSLLSAESIFKCATSEEQYSFITRATVANLMKRFARRMLYFSREEVTLPQEAMGMTLRQTKIMYNIYKMFGDPLDNTKFESTVDDEH